MKKLFIKTHGCQMNFYDSEKMVDLLKPHGYEIDKCADNADLIVVNTCHIREKAVEKTYSELGRIRDQVKKRKEKTGKQSIVAVAGCVAQAQGEEIMKRSPWVDIVVGPQSYQNLPELIAKVDPIKKNNQINIDFPTIPKFDYLESEINKRGPSAFLTIQEGCDKFCAFCVVPYTRGAEYSRPIKSILDEAKKLIDIGVKEITLLGQNVNAWSYEGRDNKIWGLGRLIAELAKLKDLKFIRYTTSHPLDMDLELIEAHRDISKLMPYLHLPVQSGSDNILKLMNRKHTAKDYRKVIEKVRDFKPDIAISGDFIVGFPGETDKDHKETLNLIKEIQYSQAYSFKYSVRPGTPAAISYNQVNEEVKNKRLYEVQEILREQQLNFNLKSINSFIKVLVLRNGKKSNQYLGRSPFNQSVYFSSEHKNLIGSTIDINILEAFQNSLTGKIIKPNNQKL
ncbi:tRNA (N6-isopentenyl adenosine(37)-C2)-methylthiotransferase MiaB [Alphaproteobacteria bacterium]|nr:tRNA (N6-isopentenyl adenosine(37)-C2)-methylthiotransferase MiaB [Alphaproteobacteria bacterium]